MQKPLLLAATLISLILISCSNGSGASPAELFDAATVSGPYAVGVATLDLVDASRPTAANHEYPGSDERRLPTDIYYPASGDATEVQRDTDVESDGAPYPLIAFSHGLSAAKALYGSYAQRLASHGYMVVLPDYPLSNLTAPGGPRLNAVLEQPKDLSFVIDKMLKFNEEAGNRFEGAVDPDRIGATGHSLGAMTTFMSVYGPDRDDRIKAALPFETPGCFFPEDYPADVSVPILFTSGTNDLITPPVSAVHVYDIAKVPRYLVTIKGADHTRFAEVDLPDTAIVGRGVLQGIGQGDFASDVVVLGQTLAGGISRCGINGERSDDPPLDADRQREILRTLQVVFFDAYLRDDKDSLDLLEQIDGFIPEVSIQSDTE